MTRVTAGWIAAFTVVLGCASAARAQVERVWLSHGSSTPDTVVVSWMTQTPGDSTVHFARTDGEEQTRRIDGERTLHHVEIPVERGERYTYQVSTGDQRSRAAEFRALPEDILRVAVVANWQGRPDLGAIEANDVHLLLTAGDNISNIHGSCGAGNEGCVHPYAELVDRYPELLRSTLFMPVLGNHDKEVRPRGAEPPEEPVYDIEATAFRRFFALPGDEWKWHFDVPEFGLRLIALDLNHVSDAGTTWQACRAFDEDSTQFKWYRELMAESDQPFVVTVYNEKHSTVRHLAKGGWGEMVRGSRLALTGFGHFAERAEPKGVTQVNTSLQGEGDRYPDPESQFIESQNNYVLLTFDGEAGTMVVELKNLAGESLDRTVFERDVAE